MTPIVFRSLDGNIMKDLNVSTTVLSIHTLTSDTNTSMEILYGNLLSLSRRLKSGLRLYRIPIGE